MCVLAAVASFGVILTQLWKPTSQAETCCHELCLNVVLKERNYLLEIAVIYETQRDVILRSNSTTSWNTTI